MFRVRIMPENKRMVMIDRNEYAAETEKKNHRHHLISMRSYEIGCFQAICNYAKISNMHL